MKQMAREMIKNRERWRSDVEAGRGDGWRRRWWVVVGEDREVRREKTGVSSSTRRQGEATHYSPSQTSSPGLRDSEERWRASI